MKLISRLTTSAGRRQTISSWVAALGLLGALLSTAAIASAAGAQEPGWTQIGFDINGEEASDLFGTSVAISADGTRVVAGAPGAGPRGRVSVFDLTDGGWVQVGAAIDGEGEGDRSGAVVAISVDGLRIAAGVSINDGNGGNSGHVRVFDLVDGMWSQVGGDIDGEAAGDFFGSAVAMSADGSRVSIGATHHGVGESSSAGHVRVFELAAGEWLQVGGDIDGEAAGDFSGGAVAMSADGSRVAVGATGNEENGLASGHVRVFDLIDDAWTQVGSDIDGEAELDFSGGEVVMSADGSRLSIGASNNGGGGQGAGHVRVFDLVGGQWTQVGGDIDGETGDRFGTRVAMSTDGSRVVAAAIGSEGTANADGSVRVFELVDGSWLQIGGDVDAVESREDFGLSVAVTADGTRFVAGARRNDANGFSSGRVALFELPEPAGVLCNDLEVTVDLSKDQEPTAGDDVIRGTEGDDLIDALGGNDTICALQGNDVVDAGDGADKVFAGAGNDRLDGGSGNDKLVGGLGDDTIIGGNGNDRIQGGSGEDDLSGGNGLDRIAGGNDNDVLRGGGSTDLLFGNLGRDQLFGDAGNDVLRGGAWKDFMDGGAGTDDGCTLTDPGGLTETRINCEAGVFGR